MATDSRSRLWLTIALPLLLATVIVWWPGCRAYPAVTSAESLALVKLLVTAANTRDEARLATAEKKLDVLRRKGQLSSVEQDVFEGIIAQCRRGEWADAEQAAFRFAQDQVGR